MNILPFDRQIAVIAALCEGMSIRSVERLTGVNRGTIGSLGLRVGLCCDMLHDRMMRNLRVTLIELDELWAFVGKKQKRVTRDEAIDKGDMYTFLALDPTSKAILAYRTGKRDRETTALFVHDLKGRVLGAPVISSDAFVAYEEVVCEAFAPRLHYGQVIKRYRAEHTVEAARRYSPAAVVDVDRRVIYGRPAVICTSHAERQNLNVRMTSRRFTRLTSGFSKKLVNHGAAVGLLVAFHNFCRPHETIRTTPAVALGITDHVWSIAELIDAAFADPPEPEGRQIGPFRVIDGGAR
jgi:IS1 family transposase